MSNPQASGPQGPPQQQQAQLLKADDILKLQCLSEDAKQKYRPVVQNLWTMIQTKPQGSHDHQQARTKLQDWSQKLIAQERAHRQRMKQQQQANQGQSSQPNQQAQSNQQPPPNEAQQQGQPQQPLKQEGASQTQNQSQGARPQQATPPQINPEIVRHVSSFPYYLPPAGPHAGTPEGDAKIKEYRNNYLMALNKQEKATQRIKAFANVIEQRQKSGQEVPPEIITNKQAVEKEYQNAKEFVDGFRKRQAQWKQEHEQRRGQQQNDGPQAQSQPAQPSQPNQQQQRPPSQPNIKEEPQIKVEGGQQSQTTQQFNMQGGAPQQTQPQQQGAQQVPGSSVAQQQQQPLRQPPAPASQNQQNMPPQFAQPGQPQRPQINPQQANAHQHQQSNSPHPQSATSNPAGPPVPLTHQAAVNAAQRSYSNPDPNRTTTPMQQHGSQGSFHAPGSREREQLNNPKMPIPRTLNVTQPSPVGMGQARPTMSGPTNGAPGPMGQPVIPKFPPFQLEGEGDRVLSKRKLDELVRQVTGGSEEALTPEVEEAILQLADDFVDTVISNACKLSKLRESPQLDVRDIQLVLERNYNIRIPGYASDEVRTVRKLVPAPGWTQKMNAVQAAKVMGGKTDI